MGKTQLTLAKQVTQGVPAGLYISFSFMLCMTVGGQLGDNFPYPGIQSFILGAVGFPLGLTVIMVAGADLFTSSCMYMITAWLEGRIALYYVLKVGRGGGDSGVAACRPTHIMSPAPRHPLCHPPPGLDHQLVGQPGGLPHHGRPHL